MATDKSVLVIGSGIIGISIGLELLKRGLNVKIIDRCEPSQGASEGNAGAFALADIIPIATPGLMRVAPSWLLDPLGPLSIRPSYFFSIMPWLLRFWRASWADRFPSLMHAQAQLMALSRSALERQAAAYNGEPLLRREGQLRIYDNEHSFGKSLSYWNACKEYGINHNLLRSSGEIGEIQSGICSRFKYAGYTPDWINVTDPKLWLKNLRNAFVKGGQIVQKKADSITLKSDTTIVRCSGEEFPASYVVIAAGAWSKSLAQSIGDKFPLDTERGYNTTFNSGVFKLQTHLTFADHGFVISRIGDNIRVGGAVELGGLNAPPNFARSRILLSKARQFLPNMKVSNATDWMGFRPSMPDSLPVIGPSPKTFRVLYAFGHGHLGLTQSAATAELIGDCVFGRKWPISDIPFSPTRFHC